MTKVTSFAPFLERLQQSEMPLDRTRSSSATPSSANVTDHILQALQVTNVVDPSILLNTGLDFVEMGRAIERLRSLDGIVMTDINGRQVIQRGPKFGEVLSLLSLS
jgi:hypothetical protein